MSPRLLNETREERRKRFISETEIDIAKGLKASSLSGMRLYVQGLTYLDCSLYFDIPQEEFRSQLANGAEKIRKPWSSDGAQAGGFPAHAIRCAAPKGVKLFLGGRIPKYLPAPIDRLIQENDVDTQFAQVVDSPIAKSLKMRFADGQHCFLVDQGTATYSAPIPDAPFDVMLLNPGSKSERRPILQQLRDLVARRPQTVVGLIARGDWTEVDWAMVRDTNFRVYLSKRELADTVVGQFLNAPPQDPRVQLELLRAATGSSVIVTVTLGKEGSLLMNHVPYLARCPAPCVRVVRSGGSGDTFATTATLSAAEGASDRVCCSRANIEASRFVAGRSLASNFAELDAEAETNPEIIETRVPFTGTSASSSKFTPVEFGEHAAGVGFVEGPVDGGFSTVSIA